MAIIKPEQLGSGLYSISGSFSGSFQGAHLGTASYATNALSSSYAATASYAPSYLPLTGGTIDGNVNINGTASIAFLNVTYESASVIYSSGSNQFGDATNDTQTLIGTVIVSGSQQITGSLNVTSGITGSLFGTSSYALTSSYSPITIGTTPITSGVAGRVLFQNGGDVVGQDSGLFWDNTNKRLGIGTTTPLRNLDIFANNPEISTRIASSGVGKFSFRSSIDAEYGGISLNAASGEMRIFTGISYFPTFYSNSTEIMRITTGGNALIGTTTDNGGKLQVKAGGALSTDIAFKVRNSADTADLAIINGLGNIGIGTSNPVYTLDVNGTTRIVRSGTNIALDVFVETTYNAMTVNSSGTTLRSNGTNPSLTANDFSVSNGQVGIRGRRTNTLFNIFKNYIGDSFSIIDGANGAADFIVLANGNVGIGTTTPTYKLDVSGSTRITNGLTVTGSLLAPSITGSLQGTASHALFAETASNILGGTATHIPYFITDTTLATSSIYQSGSTSIIINQDNNTAANPEALYVWQPHPTSINVVSGKGNLDNYLQLNIQNTNQGTAASSDIVATANNGSEVDNYIDMGINSENFTGFLGGDNDSYLYAHSHNMWIGNINDGYDVNFFNSSSEEPIIKLTPAGQAEITGSLHGTASWARNAVTASNSITSSYALLAANSQNAISASYALNSSTSDTSTSASHAIIADSALSANYAANAGNGGVTNLIAGSGVTLLPPTGVGAVTIITTGGGGVTIISGSNITQSFVNSDTWIFNHGLGIRTPTITVFDSNYNQIIPENIVLTNTASATITFPTLESGFAVGMVGGVAGNAYSASYALFSTYASTASVYLETDPIFVAKSGSFATTGSNSFKGNQTITGSLIVSSSNSLTVIGPMTVTGSLLVSGSTTQIGNNTLVGNTVLSGSINVSGSQMFKGNLDLTGSLYVSGSTIKIGNNTLIGNNTITGSNNISGSNIIVGNNTITGINTIIGNTILSGSITISGSTTNTIIGNTNVYGAFNVSGSSTFSNSLFTVTGSTFVKGVTNISGSTNITGSLNVIGDVNVISGSGFYRWGNKLFNYAQFAETASLPLTANVSGSFILPTTYFAEGISVVSSSRITFANTGLYNIQFSAVVNQGSGKPNFSIWFKETGSNIEASNTIATLEANSQALLAWNFAYPFNSGSYVEMWYNTTGANTVLTANPAVNGQPSSPALIVTVTQIA